MKVIKVLEQFEGPLLEHVETVSGEVFIKKFATVENGHYIFVMTKTTTRRIKAYLAKRINLYDLMFEFNEYAVVYNSKTEEYKTVKVKNLPQDYFPTKDAMYDESLSENEY